MALDVKDLCRFCASKDEFSKDLLSDNNKDVVKFIEEFVQIVVFSNDNLPTKICINCEEKMVSFELFVLECHKTQEVLKKMCEDAQTEQLPIKVEDGPTCQYAVKSEVKAEDTEDLCTLNNDASLLMLDMYNDESNMDDQVLDNDIACDPDDDDYEENISIAALKTIKKNKIKRKEITENEAEELKQVLQRSNLKVKDFVKLECKSCELSFKTWCSLRFHFYKIHKCQQYVFCICGFVIKSKSVLYKHVSEHKRESRKLRKENETEENSSDLQYSNRNVKDFIKFLCHCCKKEYSSWYSLRKHTVWAHKVSPIVTCICGIVLKSKSVMYKHVHDHRNPNILSCDKCPRITKTLSALNKHKMRHIPKEQRKFCCASCDKFFTSKDALKSHERSHIPIEDRKIYNCDQCNMKFTTRSSQMSHKRVVHEKIKGYVCDLCGYACGTNGELRQHRAIHSDDKPFVCRTCSKPFKTYSNLKTHMDTHEDTAYECYICRRILNSRRTLRKHLLVHEDKCRHVCSYCNKAFKRRQTLKVHMYTHTGDKPLTCKWCDERFSYASTLRSHRLRCHPEKMAAQHLSYPTYAHNTTQDDYIKNSSEIVNVPAEKNEVEAM